MPLCLPSSLPYSVRWEYTQREEGLSYLPLHTQHVARGRVQRGKYRIRRTNLLLKTIQYKVTHLLSDCTAAAVLPKQDSGASQIQVYPVREEMGHPVGFR